MAGILDFGPDPMSVLGAGIGQGFGNQLGNYQDAGIMDALIKGGSPQPQDMMQRILQAPLPIAQKNMALNWILKNEDVKSKVATRQQKQQEEVMLKDAVIELSKIPNISKKPTEEIVSFLVNKGLPVQNALSLANMFRMNNREQRISEEGIRKAYGQRRKELTAQINNAVGAKKKELEKQLANLGKAQNRDLKRFKDGSLESLEIDSDGEVVEEVIDQAPQQNTKELTALEAKFPAKSNEGKRKRGPSGAVYQSKNGKWARVE